MLLGLGVDIVECARIGSLWERHGARFLERCFRPEELAPVLARPRPAAVPALAARWAAKEAFLKAVGGLPGVVYRDIAVVREAGGEPALRLHGAAARALADRGAAVALVSLSHERRFAVAVVALSGRR